MARTNRARWAVVGVVTWLAACTDTGVIGNLGQHCDPMCAEAFCDGVPACGPTCESDDLCRAQDLGRYCDPDRLACVECYRSRHCEDEEHCDNGACVRDDADEDASE